MTTPIVVAAALLALVSVPAGAQQTLGEASDPKTVFTLWQEVVTTDSPRPSETRLSEKPIYRPSPIAAAQPAPWSGPPPLHGVSWTACQQGVTETAATFVSEWATSSYVRHARIETSSPNSLTLAYTSGRRHVLSWKCVPTI